MASAARDPIAILATELNRDKVQVGGSEVVHQMGYNESAARAWTRAASRLAVLPALILCIGGGFGLFAAVGGVLRHQISAKHGALFVVVALVMLGGAALQIALGRQARRITEKWDSAEPPGGGVQRNDR